MVVHNLLSKQDFGLHLHNLEVRQSKLEKAFEQFFLQNTFDSLEIKQSPKSPFILEKNTKEILTALNDYLQDQEDIELKTVSLTYVMSLLKYNIAMFKRLEQTYNFRMSIVLHDCIYKVKPENLNFEQINLIKETVEELVSNVFTKQDFLSWEEKLFNNNLDWVFGANEPV